MTQKKRKSKSAPKETNLTHWLINKLRRISYQWPDRKEAIKRARVSRGKYKCAICSGENFGPKDIQLDHINPVIDPHTGFQDWNTYIQRLFVPVNSWQLLCKPCHEVKTRYEQHIRSIVRNEKNGNDGDL